MATNDPSEREVLEAISDTNDTVNALRQSVDAATEGQNEKIKSQRALISALEKRNDDLEASNSRRNVVVGVAVAAALIALLGVFLGGVALRHSNAQRRHEIADAYKTAVQQCVSGNQGRDDLRHLVDDVNSLAQNSDKAWSIVQDLSSQKAPLPPTAVAALTQIHLGFVSSEQAFISDKAGLPDRDCSAIPVPKGLKKAPPVTVKP